MSRIYLVKTPNGEHLVEAANKSQAINHCVSADYSAEPISASDLHAHLQAGATVEKAQAKGKKSSAGETSGQPNSNPPAASTDTGAAVSTAPQINSGKIDHSPVDPGLVLPPAATPRPSWNAPESFNAAVISEQQRINPAAAAAAFSAPGAILPVPPAAARPNPEDWVGHGEQKNA